MADCWLGTVIIWEEVDATIIARHVEHSDLVRIRCAANGRSDACLRACERHIALAPLAGPALQRAGQHRLPRHFGYEYLVLALEERGRVSEALVTAQRAHAEGWSGHWEGRIRRLWETLDGS